LAEDDPIWQDILSRAIRSALKDCTDIKITVFSTYDCVNKALDHQWDLLVSDLGFGTPKQSLDIMGRHLIEKAIDKNIPVIVVSGTPSTNQVVRDISFECRPFDYFLKHSFRSKDFIFKVRSALKLDPAIIYRQSPITYDVFLCSYPEDRDEVRRIAALLRIHGLNPWFAEEQTTLHPGLSWQKIIEDSIEYIHAIAMFVGVNGIPPWDEVELRIIINRFIFRNLPAVPVLLENASVIPDLPLEFIMNDWIDLRSRTKHSIDSLVAALKVSGLQLSAKPKSMHDD
jgi:hypothetical protein